MIGITDCRSAISAGCHPPAADISGRFRYFIPLSPRLGKFALRMAGAFTDDHMPWLARPMRNVHMVGGFNGRGIGPGAYWGGILADWAMGLSDADLPIPAGRPPHIRLRSAKRHIYSVAFPVWRLAEQLLR
jgi:glycine/D-amino acid oxidase-like deaminating enzyme